MKYPILVFDWDGTIIDSQATIVECLQHACRALGLADPGKSRASHVIGLGLHEAIRIVAPTLPAERYPQFVACYRDHFLAREERMRLFPGMQALIARLAADRRLAIATGKSRRGLERALAATGLAGCFSASRCADETHPKPHPAMLLELMEALGAAREHMLMIGDTSHDVAMARSAGVNVVAVTYGAHPEESLRASCPHCVASVAELERWLQIHG